MANQLHKMNRNKLFILAIIFLILLGFMRLGWMQLFQEEMQDQPQIENGVLDLRGWEGLQDEIINLDGQWKFYPNQLTTNAQSPEHELIQVPKKWDNSWPEGISPGEYGTYTLTIHVDQDVVDPFSIHIPSVRNGSNLYVNDRLVASSGNVTTDKEEYRAQNLPYTTTITPNEDGVMEITIQAADFLTPNRAGIVRSVKFGETSLIQQENNLNYSMQLILMVAFIILAIYALGLFFVNDRDWSFIHVSLLLLGATVTHSLSSDEKILATWLQLDFEWNVRLANLASTAIIFALWMIIRDALVKNAKVIHYGVLALSLLSILTIFILPIKPLEQLQDLFSALLIFALIFSISTLFRKNMLEKRDNVWIMLALLALLNSYVWWGIWMTLGINIIFYPIDLLITIACFTIMWLIRYFDMYSKSQQQTIRLQKVADEKDEFLARTSHELRNPLHGMLNLTQTTLERNKAVMDSKSIKELETVNMVGKRLTLLLNDLMDMASLKITKPHIHKDTFYIQSIASGVVDMFQFTIDKDKIQLKNAIPDNLPAVCGDENRIIQVLYNLIQNAVKFTNQGQISIHAKKAKQKIIITVTDTGEGMDKETIERVLHAYEQGDHAKDQAEGVGLGLSISKQLIELHGESLSIDSKPTHGTSISFCLPISKEQPANKSIEDPIYVPAITADQVNNTKNQNEKPRILMVDDDIVNLQVLESVLSEQGYEIVTLQHSENVLTELHTNKWDLLIMDVMMPHLSGYDLTIKVRERFNQTELPILLLTARNTSTDIEISFMVGANDYVTKPVDAEELKARVSNLVNIKQLTQNQLEMETRWLQAQIQPHFIFNTLNSINALSNIDIEKMRILVEEFSGFLRNKFNFHAFHNKISVEEELAIVDSFLYIEQVRFGPRLNVCWNLTDIESFYLPTLTIQPIVENAIRHGIMKQSDGGTIEIKAFKKKDYLRIIIKDNGVGMEDPTICLNEKGIGLVNTNRRLIKAFGTGLNIKSIKGVGTVVAFNVSQGARRL